MPADRSDLGLFIPTTQVWDISDVNDKNQKELLVRLYQNLNKVSIAINKKDTGIYDTSEFVNGQTFFPNPVVPPGATNIQRQVYRKVINFGALPNNAAKSVAHGLTIAAGSACSFTRIYGTASNPAALTFIPIPYASSVAGGIIELSVTSANVVITTASDLTAYTVCYVILEYLKQ